MTSYSLKLKFKKYFHYVKILNVLLKDTLNFNNTQVVNP